jgi:hypothetical protein
MVPKVCQQLSDYHDVADSLWILCSYVSTLTIYSKNSNGAYYFNRKRHNQPSYWKYIGHKKSSEMLRPLIGWKHASISHERFFLNPSGKKPKPGYELTENSIDWYVQRISLVDPSSGEISDDLPIRFVEHCKSLGHKACLYRLDNYTIGCIVVTPTLLHTEAIAFAAALVKQFPTIKLDESSLFRTYPLPLSKNEYGDLCSFFDDRDGRASLDYLLSESRNSSEKQPEEPQSISYEDVQIQAQHTPNNKIIKTNWLVEEEFRAQLIEGFGDDTTIISMIGLFLFSTFRDSNDSSYAIIDTDTMLQILGKKHSKKNLITSHLNQLNELIDIEVNKPFFTRSKATSFKIVNPPQYMLEAQKHYQQPKKSPVWLIDVKKKPKRESATFDAVERLDDSTIYPNEVSSLLLTYLNNLPSNTFQKTTDDHWNTMNAMAENLTGESREHSLSSLRAIQEHPKPIYSQGKNTTRIYADGGHFQTLKKEIRELVFDSCIKLDLAHSQLSIAAHITNCQSLLTLCSSDALWEYLVTSTGLEKSSIKEWVYSVLFSDHEVITIENVSTNLKPAFKRLIKTPEIRDFLKARTEYLVYNFKDKSTDAFGNELVGRTSQKFNSLVSSIELSILKPGLEFLINKKTRTRITLWLHDGFYLSGSRKETEINAKSIMKIVNQEALSLNIPTRLRMEERQI